MDSWFESDSSMRFFSPTSLLASSDRCFAASLEYERKLFYMLFATKDQKEGMRAFVEKRSPRFTGH